MDVTLYHLADWFFMVLHPAIILFNLFGWIWKRTRKANLVLLLLTAFSWFVLGIWKGIGYCPFTEWHWEVLRKLGYERLPASYIKFLIERITGIEVNAGLVDVLTVSLFALALGASLYVNLNVKNKIPTRG